MKKASIILLALSGIINSQTKSDYYIISNPANYTIFNQYQQSMSAADKREILTNAPLRVENDDQTLGDQISRAAKCVYEGENYFLLKNDDDGFSGETKNGRQTFKNCLVIEDTVTIVNGAIAMALAGGRARTLARGTNVARYFKSGARCYSRVLDGTRGGFGWCAFEPGSRNWKKIETAVVKKTVTTDTVLPALLRQRVEAKIAAANDAYKACFDHFNGQTNDMKSVPFWKCEKTAGGLRCELSEPWKRGDRLSESTDALVQELENLLLGSDFGVRYNNGVMTIQRRIKVSP